MAVYTIREEKMSKDDKKMRLGLLTDMKIATIKGQIEQQAVDAIVCAVDNSLNKAASGTVTKAVLSIGGKTLKTECKSRFPSGIKYGEVVAIDAGNLKCKKVYLTALPDFVTEAESDNCEKILHNVVMKIMDMVIEDRHTSVAFPAIGTSKLNLSVDKVANTLFDAVETKMLQSGCLVDVRFVLHDQDTLQIFDKIGIERPHLSDADAQMITDVLVDAHVEAYPKLFSPAKTLLVDVLYNIEQRGYYEEQYVPITTKESEVYSKFCYLINVYFNGRRELRALAYANIWEIDVRSVKIFQSIPGCTQLSIKDKISHIKSSFFVFNFLLLFKGIKSQHELFDLSELLRSLDLSEEELILMRCTAATFKDNCILQDRNSVAKIQSKLIQCLRWVATKNNMNADRRLSQILDTLTALRNLKETSFNRCVRYKKFGRYMQRCESNI